MWIMYDFKCTHCDNIFERMVTSSIFLTDCPLCGAYAERLISTPHIDYRHMGLDPVGNPTAGDKWARWHELEAKKDPI